MLTRMFNAKNAATPDSTQSKGEITILLSTPRVGSTAVLMSMSNTDRELFHEPGIRAFQTQFSPVSIKGKATQQPARFPTFQSVLEAINLSLEQNKNVFIKDTEAKLLCLS